MLNRGVYGLLRSLGELVFRKGSTGSDVGPRRRLRVDDTASLTWTLTDGADEDEVTLSAAVQTAGLGLAAVATSGSATDLTTGTLPAGRLPALTGDVTSSAGSAATTIAANAVTYAKLQDVTSSRLLGRATAGSGDCEEIAMGAGVSISTGFLTVAVPAVASQAEQEAGTVTSTYTSPGRQQYHPSAAKAWAHYDSTTATPTLNASYNVSSLTDNSVGQITVNFSVAMSSANYCAIASGGTNSADTAAAFAVCYPSSRKTTGGIGVSTYDGTFGSTLDMKNVCVAVFGDQA
jgi:hypothetical protein